MSMVNVLAGLVPSRASLLGLWLAAVSLCLHVAFLEPNLFL